MAKNKYIIYLVASIIIIIGATLLYFQMYEKDTTGIFPNKLGDMNLAVYEEGDTAIKKINDLHGNSLRKIEKGYVVEYKSSSGSKAKFWVSESVSNDNAVSLTTAMSKMVGKSGMYSDPIPMNIEGITVYFVLGHMEHMGLYHYFYPKDNKVYWIQIDNPDESYRINIVKESIRKI